MIAGRLLTRNGQRLYLEELGSSVTMKDTLLPVTEQELSKLPMPLV